MKKHLRILHWPVGSICHFELKLPSLTHESQEIETVQRLQRQKDQEIKKEGEGKEEAKRKEKEEMS